MSEKVKQKKGIIYQILFGTWFLFWSAGIVYLVFMVGFLPMFAIMLGVSIIALIILGREIKNGNKSKGL